MTPYIPKALPVEEIDLVSRLNLIVEASNNLVRYDEKLKTLTNPTIFLSPLHKKEAVKSSQIEGTQATLDEVLRSEADVNIKVENNDLKEVLNYRDAMRFAMENLEQKPLNLNTIKRIQEILLTNVRGADRSRGEFRREQVWIGPKGCSQDEADYVPPTWENVRPLLDNWEKYIHTNEMNPIIQTAIMHAQFEMIHPFVDGNGRVGRILIPIYLYQKSLISEPMFYLSDYLEENREEYVNSLSRISNYNDWNSWIDFFLTAVNEQAQRNLRSVNDIRELRDATKDKLVETRSPYQTRILDALFMFPFFTSTRFAQAAKISNRRTAIRIINKLEEMELIYQIEEKSGSSPAMYMFPQLANLIKG